MLRVFIIACTITLVMALAQERSVKDEPKYHVQRKHVPLLVKAKKPASLDKRHGTTAHHPDVYHATTSQSSQCSAPAAITTSGTGISTSPSGNYVTSENCLWSITAPVGQYVVLNFSLFMTEDKYDTFTVYNSNVLYPYMLAQLSGQYTTTLPPTLYATSNTMTVAFVSDPSNVNAGVKASVFFSATPPPQTSQCSSPAVITTSSTLLSTNHPGKYISDQNCQWTITAPPGQYAVLKFTSFATELNFDYFIVYNGPSTTSPLVASLSGTTLPPTVYGTSNTMTVVFLSDVSNVYAGVKAMVTFSSSSPTTAATTTTTPRTTTATMPNPLCTTPTAIVLSGTVINTNLNAVTYAINMNCQWSITAPAGQSIAINISSFNTEYGYDALYIYDGPTIAATLLSGAGLSGVIAPGMTFYGSGSQMTIVFTSDSSNVAAGVRAIVSFYPTGTVLPCAGGCFGKNCLINNGGQVLPRVQVIPVYWSSAVRFQQNLTNFYCDIVGSPWMNTLGQYGPQGGSCLPPVVGTGLPTGILSDAQIGNKLIALINRGVLPTPTANTYYAVHFPSTVTSITLPGSSPSCVSGGFCAFHSAAVYTNTSITFAYGVVPDQSGGCSTGCGSNAIPVNNLISVSSHELAEAITDPYSNVLAWYNNVGGEIGDLCNALQTTVTFRNGANATTSYVVQKEWSNCGNSCV